MPTRVDREDVRRLLEEGAQLVEVLPRHEYEEAHLPGAINIPLKELTAGAAATLDRDRAVITYCYDTQCDMSPRAAWRLETLGFGQVYHYAPGKADWLGAGLPIEGTAAGLPFIGTLAHRDVPTCGLDTPLEEVRRELEQSEWDSCFVLNDDGVVLGRIYESGLAGATGTAQQVMDPGPSTYRPDITAMEMAQRMEEGDLQTAPVTTSDGRLIGMVRRNDIDAAAREQQ